MPEYTAYICVYHRIDGIEANSIEEAEELAISDYIWDDHITDSKIDIQADSLGLVNAGSD